MDHLARGWVVLSMLMVIYCNLNALIVMGEGRLDLAAFGLQKKVCRIITSTNDHSRLPRGKSKNTEENYKYDQLSYHILFILSIYQLNFKKCILLFSMVMVKESRTSFHIM